MAFQYGVALRTARVNQIQTLVNNAGVLKIFSGPEPANCAAADPSGLLATINLPATFLTSANGVTTLAGTWSATATAPGTAATFRMYDSGGVCHVQGNCTTDLVLNNTSLTAGQTVSVTTFSVTGGNA